MSAIRNLEKEAKKAQEDKEYMEAKKADEIEIAAAKTAASLLHPTHSKAWYAELDKCPALQRQQAAFWKRHGSSKGW